MLGTRNGLCAGLALLLCLELAACGSAPTVVYRTKPTEFGEVKAVILLPGEYFFRGIGAENIFEKWVDVAHLLTERFGVMVVGPDEYRITVQGPLGSPQEQTTLTPLIRSLRLKPEDVVLLRIRMVEDWQEQGGSKSATGAELRARTARESRATFSAELTSYATGAVLAEYDSGRLPLSMVSGDDADARPDITALFREQLVYFLGDLSAHYKLAEWPPEKKAAWPVLRENPLEAGEAETLELPSLKKRLLTADEFTRDAALRSLVEYRHPGMDRGMARAMVRTGTLGLYVESAAPCWGLQGGDVITGVNGDALRREYQLLRAWLAGGGALRLLVERSGASVYVESQCGGK